MALSLARRFLGGAPLKRAGAGGAPRARCLAQRSVPKKTDMPKTFVQLEIKDSPGSLQDTLRLFWKHDVNMTRIESRPSTHSDFTYMFNIDFEGRPGERKPDELLADLKQECITVHVMDDQAVPWFPKKVKDLDLCTESLDGGTDLINDDHPGFTDEAYMARRNHLAKVARDYRQGQEIPHVVYAPEEVETWGLVYDKLAALSGRYACKEYRYVLPLLERECGYRRDNIPQLQDISSFLKEVTGFTLRPVTGLLSARDFLSGLAFRVFFSTQYIRHHSKPLYTPEPDVCHELLGHAPLFADPDFADFSQQIGLASLGATDADIDRLASCYWFTVEFGLLREDGEVKAFGAGLLSSFGEMEYACSPTRPAGGTDERPKIVPWDPFVAATTNFPITTYQPTYFIAESMQDAKEKMTEFCDSINRPFFPTYKPYTETISVDRAVKREAKTSTGQLQVEKQKEFFAKLQAEKDAAQA
jgi:phenylalanine-4-hydroxylase